jgi:hypothetical protein
VFSVTPVGRISSGYILAHARITTSRCGDADPELLTGRGKREIAYHGLRRRTQKEMIEQIYGVVWSVRGGILRHRLILHNPDITTGRDTTGLGLVQYDRKDQGARAVFAVHDVVVRGGGGEQDSAA